MPRRPVDPKSRNRYHALKRLNPDTFAAENTADEFDKYVQYREDYVRAGREDEVFMVYAEAIETLLVEAYAMMVEATDFDKSLVPKIGQLEILMDPGPSNDSTVMELVESRFVPPSTPAARVKKAIFRNAQLQYMREAEQARQTGDKPEKAQMELDLD